MAADRREFATFVLDAQEQIATYQREARSPGTDLFVFNADMGYAAADVQFDLNAALTALNRVSRVLGIFGVAPIRPSKGE